MERKAFDNKHVTFEEHVRYEHNMWHYLYFIVLIKVKDPTDFTGPESYVHLMVKVTGTYRSFLRNVSYRNSTITFELNTVTLQEKCLDWFPRLRAISLAVEDVEGEQNEWRTLHNQLQGTQVTKY